MEKQELKNEYPNLNSMLNEYCLWMENTSFLNNSLYFYNLTAMLKKYLQSNFTFQQLKELEKKSQEDVRKLSLTEILDFSIEYIEERMPEYKNDFLRDLSDGTINIVVDPSTENADNLENESGKDQNKHNYINTVLRHNTEDPATLIHEFVHSLNNEEENRISRDYITEAISIYFEIDMCNFLKKKGFSSSEVMAHTIFRFKDLYYCVCNLIPKFSVLTCFCTTGPISNTSYQDMRDLNIFPRPKTKEEFYHIVERYEKELAEEKKQAEALKTKIDQPAQFDPLIPFGYIIGTLSAYYAIENNNEDMHQAMINLNTLANKKDFDELMSTIGIDVGTAGKLKRTLLPALEKKVQEIKDYGITREEKGKEK